MNYSEDAFFDLLSAVEEQGGQYLIGRQCKARTYELVGDKRADGLKRDSKTGKMTTMLPACGNESLFEVTYASADSLGRETGTKTVVVCAVDDDMGRWPRFQKTEA